MGAKTRCLLGADRSVSGSCERLPGGRIGSVAVEQSTERGGGFGQLCTPKRTGSFRPNSVSPDHMHERPVLALPGTVDQHEGGPLSERDLPLSQGSLTGGFDPK